ncbi:hypothetical protein M758_UG242300 [Ceratodon purpureus]|nr:hypothetical protein M758_UG242300 [Ceratodon purpureus]
METSNGLGHVLVLCFLTVHNLCTPDLVHITLRRYKEFYEAHIPNALRSGISASANGQNATHTGAVFSLPHYSSSHSPCIPRY